MKLSDERIKELCAEHGDFFKAARAIETEAFRNGELAMRERAARRLNVLANNQCGAWSCYDAIRNLEPEGPK